MPKGSESSKYMFRAMTPKRSNIGFKDILQKLSEEDGFKSETEENDHDSDYNWSTHIEYVSSFAMGDFLVLVAENNEYITLDGIAAAHVQEVLWTEIEEIVVKEERVEDTEEILAEELSEYKIDITGLERVKEVSKYLQEEYQNAVTRH